MKRHLTRSFYILFFSILHLSIVSKGQGLNHQWLIGYWPSADPPYTTSGTARLLFDNANVTVLPENRELDFISAQANISDENGNLLMATNGCWIMNAAGDTMINGSGLNPDPFTTMWCTPYSGIPYIHADVILPMPDDSTKYILFHHSGNASSQFQDAPSELDYSIIDMTLDSGLGGVTQKNVIAIQDRLLPGVGACKHANGRDWWVVMLRDSSDLIYKILLTPQGIASVDTQSLTVPSHNRNTLQPIFSPDGNKFAYRYYYGITGQFTNEVRLFDFDRCSGMFSNPVIISWQSTSAGVSVNFSPNSKYIYTTTFDKVYQINTDTSNVPSSLQVVAVNDGFFSPVSPFQTDFWTLYLAANGKLYISSGSGVVDMHYIDYPDSAGSSCSVQQHALHLPCWSVRGNVNHPNYYLGAVAGSVCDSLGVGLEELKHNFHFSIYPNPSSGNFNIIYLLPQNQNGLLEIFDINGKKVFTYNLPPWSTLQNISLPATIANGLYNCVIASGSARVSKKLAVIKTD